MPFDPDAFLAEPAGFDPDAFLAESSGVEARILSLGGVKQSDGTYLVPGDGGTAPFRLDAQGNRLDEAPAIGEESTKEAVLNRVVATAASGAQGFVPQLKGVEGALQAVGQGKDAGEGYRAARDSTGATIEQAREKAGIGYDIAGAVLSGGVAAPETMLGRVGLSAGLGALNAASGSTADLTQDDTGGQFIKDVALGAGIGGAAAGVGEALGAGVRKLGGLVSGNAAKAITTQTAKDAAAVEKEVASLAGRVGAETQKGSRLLENIQRAASGVPVDSSDLLRVAETKGAAAIGGAADDPVLVKKGTGFFVGEETGFRIRPPTPSSEVAKEAASVAPAAAPLSTATRSAPVGDEARAAALKALGSDEARRLSEGVLGNNLKTLPGQLATIEAAKIAHAAAVEAAPGKAAQMTRDYFAQPLWQSEILPRIKGQAPRWGMAAAAMVLGQGYDMAMGEGHTGKASGAGFGLAATLGSPGMRAMLGNVVKSNRVQKAIGDKLAPILFGVANAIQRGTVVGGVELSRLTVNESALGPPNLAAEQLLARGGLKSVLGDNGKDVAASLNAPQTEVDRAIQQTAGVLLLGGALEDHNTKLEQGVDRIFKGKPQTATKTEIPDLATLKANPEAMLERFADNTGSLSTVAPQVAAELAATAQRATDYLLSVAATPPKKGPLAPTWVRSETEKRSLRLATDVVGNPLSVLDAAAAGTLVPEQVAALNAVYPMLGRQMADSALSRLQEGAKVPYRARLMLGFLTGVDVDGTLASVGPNQAAIRAQSQKPSNQGAPTEGGADKLTVAQRTAPEQQQKEA